MLQKTLNQYLKETSLVLAKVSDSNIDESRKILMHVLNLHSLTDLHLKSDYILTNRELLLLSEIISRRLNHEPLQYILKRQSFYLDEFLVNKGVLIPRPETEILVEETIKLLRSLNKPVDILEIGAGSGCISISLEKHGTNIKKIIMLEKSSSASKICKQNLVLHKTTKSHLYNISVEEFLKTNESFDLIVSNPPYINKGLKDILSPEVMLEPHSALFAPLEGLYFYKFIADNSKKLLKKGGKILVELPAEKTEKISEMFINQGFTGIKVLKDYNNLDRVMIIS